jgi:hypothetical protein
MKYRKKSSGIGKPIGWLLFILAITLLILMYMNNMDFNATVQQIIGWFGK